MNEIHDIVSRGSHQIQYNFFCMIQKLLIADWASPLLRKGVEELEKQMEKGALLEDPIAEWVLSRAEMPTAEEIHSNWSPLLKGTFGDLIELYPTANYLRSGAVNHQ